MYFLEWKEPAVRQLDKLDPSIASRIVLKVEKLKENLLSQDIKKLKGEEAFRLRVGDYRVIFEINQNTISILKVGHRQHIYDR